MVVNYDLSWEKSFPVSDASRPARRPSKQTAQEAAEHKQEVSSLNINLSLLACLFPSNLVGFFPGFQTVPWQRESDHRNCVVSLEIGQPRPRSERSSAGEIRVKCWNGTGYQMLYYDTLTQGFLHLSNPRGLLSCSMIIDQVMSKKQLC